MSVTMIVNFQAAEGNAEPLLALLQQGRDMSAQAEGCEAFEVFQGEDDPNRFVMVERWTSVEAHHANFVATIRGSGHLAKIAPLLSTPIKGGPHRAV
jgi:quinol monooxygenase YgiN